MAQSLHIGLEGTFTNLLFGICGIYFDLKGSCIEHRIIERSIQTSTDFCESFFNANPGSPVDQTQNSLWDDPCKEILSYQGARFGPWTSCPNG